MSHGQLPPKANERRRFNRPRKDVVADWIFVYAAGAAAIALGLDAIYVFINGDWRFAEEIAATSKLLALIIVTYLFQTRWLR